MSLFCLLFFPNCYFTNTVIHQYRAFSDCIHITGTTFLPAESINIKQILAKDIVLVSCISFYIFILNKIHKTIIPHSTKTRFRKRYQLLYNIRYGINSFERHFLFIVNVTTNNAAFYALFFYATHLK